MNEISQIHDVATSAAPAICSYEGIQYMAWKGENVITEGENVTNNSFIWWKNLADRLPGDKKRKFEDVVTSHSPALASFGDKLYMAWKGGDGDTSIYCSKYDGIKAIENIKDAWTKPVKTGAHSNQGPALVVTDKGLFMAWMDAGNSQVHWSEYNAKDDTWAKGTGISWENKDGKQYNAETSHAPALAAFGSTIYLVYKGKSDNRIWWSKKDGSKHWSEQHIIPCSKELTNIGPAVSVTEKTVYVAWKGIETLHAGKLPSEDPDIYFSSMVDDGKDEWILKTVRYGAKTSDRPILTQGRTPGLWWKGNNDAGIYYGPLILSPQKYNFVLDRFLVNTARSGHMIGPIHFKDTDTDYVSLSLSINDEKLKELDWSQDGCEGGNTYNLKLSHNEISLLDTDVLAFSYLIYNKGDGNSGTAKEFNKITSGVVKAYFKFIKSELQIDLKSPPEQGAFIGAQLGTWLIPLFGTDLGALAGFLTGTFWGNLQPDCDGPVAHAVRKYTGAELRAFFAENVLAMIAKTDNHKGVGASQDGCGDNSNYDVTWYIEKMP